MNPVERGKKLKQLGTLLEMTVGLARELGLMGEGKKGEAKEAKKKGKKPTPAA